MEMKRLLLSFLAISTICAFSLTGAFGYGVVGTKWEPGGDSASIFPTTSPPGTPGGATWSKMALGHSPPSGDGYHPGGALSLDFFGLTAFPDGSISTSHFPGGVITPAYNGFWGLSTGAAVHYEALAVDWALDQWAAVSGFSNLGPVADGDKGTANNSVPPNYPDWNGNGAIDANGGNIGDIRIAAYNFLGGILADTYNPGDASSSGFPWYGNIGGDGHFAQTVAGIPGFHWLNDPNHHLDGSGGDPNGFDFLTNMLHEMGHALGLDHPADDGVMNVMNMYVDRRTALRVLSADDIAGIQAIYGPEQGDGKVPEPCTMILLGSGLLGLLGLRKKFKS